MLTNELNLPEPIVAAIKADPYSREGCDFTATELIAPPYQRTLLRNHADEVDVDASERIWSLFGQSVHGILERATMPGYVLERRYTAYFQPVTGLNVKVGAKVDAYDAVNGILSDYKTTSVYKFKADLDGYRKVPPEYEAQLNIQAELIFQETGVEVQKVQIVGILRDWRRAEKLREHGYPAHPVDIMPVPLWGHEKREAYILERLRLHLNPAPEPCTPEERWEKPEQWALMKEGQKKAVRLYADQAQAEAACSAMRPWPDGDTLYYIQHRTGIRQRCENYCEVASKCPNFQEYLAKNNSATRPQ